MLEDWLARAEGKHSDLFPVTWQGFGERVSKERFARFQLLTLQKSKAPGGTVTPPLTCDAFEKGHFPNSKPFLF